MPASRLRQILVIAIGIVFGVALDFLCNGVFKIIWFVIYFPTYFVVAVALVSRLSSTRWAPDTRKLLLGLTLGATCGHLHFTTHHHLLTYTMSIDAQDPITLRSSEWSQRLVVSSDPLAKKLAGHPRGENVPVTVDLVTNYGCIQSYRVNTIDDVDVRDDPTSTWTWKGGSSVPDASGPGSEDRYWPWCKIQFYRA
jgi:hypothetical protein